MTPADSPEKPAIRALLKDRIAGLSEQLKREKSLKACKKLIESDVFANARVVMAFLSMPDEIDTSEIILEAWKTGKTVLAPKIIWKERKMIPVKIESLNHGLVAAKLGIREPASSEAFPVEKIDLTLVPAMGFSEDGHRIGHGMGFYDRFLATAQYHAVSCGLGFEEQVLPSLPRHTHDIPLHKIVTDLKMRSYFQEK